MRGWVQSLLVALFVAIPTVLVVADYMANHRINWLLLVVWFLIVILAIAFTSGSGTDEHE